MRIMIMNPAAPKDKSRSKELSFEQFQVVHDHIVDCMNNGKKIKDADIIKMLADAGKPIDFTS